MNAILSIIVLLITGLWAIATFIVANETEERKPLLPEKSKATRRPRKYNIR